MQNRCNLRGRADFHDMLLLTVVWLVLIVDHSHIPVRSHAVKSHLDQLLSFIYVH